MNPRESAFRNPDRVLDEISHEPLPQDLNLLPGILEKIQQGNRTKMKSAIRLRFAALLLAVVLITAFFIVPGAASALKKMIGYIPGFGAVDQSVPLRVLAKPVTDTRDGYTITVESALLDPIQTVLVYRITGPIPAWEEPTKQPSMCQEYPTLRLPDGKTLIYPSREQTSGGGESLWKDVFKALPATENRAVLVFPCLAELPAGEGPQNWEIPLAFAPAPPEMTVYPVIEPPATETAKPEETAASQNVEPVETTATETAKPEENPAMETVKAEQTRYGDWLWLTLEGTAALSDGYYLQTILRWQNDPAIYEVELFPDAVHMFDSAGQEISVSQMDPFAPFAPGEAQNMPLNVQTGPIVTPGPAKLVVDYVGVRMSTNTSFTIDVGSNPQPGQKWELNRDLEINGYALRVLSAEYVEAPPGQPAWMMLYLSSDSGILTVIVMDSEHETLGTGGSPGSKQVAFRSGWRYKNGFPQGIITVNVTTITVRRTGPWSIEWTPPTTTVTP